ncbi:MAG: TIGR04086 family membrane protein [Christensenellales bacterium]
MSNAATKSMNQSKGIQKTSFATFLKCALKGTLVSMVFTIAVILLFALIIKETGLSDGVISPVNQIIKIAGIIAASYFAIKGLTEKQWICGALAGIMYMLLSYLIFSLIEGVFGNVALLFSDMLMGLLIGMVFAIIAANFLGRTRKAAKMAKKIPKTKRIKKI